MSLPVNTLVAIVALLIALLQVFVAVVRWLTEASPKPGRKLIGRTFGAYVIVALLILAALLLSLQAANKPPIPGVIVLGNTTFQPSKTYTYNKVIGHSIKTDLTKPDVSVTVKSLIVNSDDSGTLLTIRFDDPDTQTNFAFHTRVNVYFIDNAGNKYQATSANPSQVQLSPMTHGTLTVTFGSLPTLLRGLICTSTPI